LDSSKVNVPFFLFFHDRHHSCYHRTCTRSACYRNIDDDDDDIDDDNYDVDHYDDDVINEPGVAGVAVASDSVVLRCHYLAAQCLAAIGEDDEACEVCIILGMQ